MANAPLLVETTDVVQEGVTAQVVNNVDAVLTDTLNNTPESASSVRLYWNGAFMKQGAGFDYSLSGVTITWLAGSGTAPNLAGSDVLVAVYRVVT